MQSKLEQLRATLDPLTPIYVLIDPMVGEPLENIPSPRAGTDIARQREESWERKTTSVVLHKTIALPPHQHPYLVHLNGTSDPLLELTLEIAEGERLASQDGGLNGEGRAAHRIGGWLQSSLRPHEHSEIISKMCRLNTMALTPATYLRLADRRVLDLLCHVVGFGQVAKQFGRLQRWTYLDVFGRLQQLRSEGEEIEILRLTVADWRRLERGDLLHRAIAQLVGELGDGAALNIDSLYQRTEIAIQGSDAAAKRWPHRFNSGNDKVAWAALTLLYPELNQMKFIPGLLEELGTEDSPPESLQYLKGEIRSAAQGLIFNLEKL